MKYLQLLLSVFIVCILLCSCTFLPERTAFGFDISDFNVVEETDSHGGFLGDGEYHLILDCSKNTEEARAIVQDWKSLPFSETLEKYLYGEEIDGVYCTSGFADEYHWPVIINGVYKFVDRHSDATDRSNEIQWHSEERYSVNFSVAIYDFDTDTLYYYSKDT